MVNKMLSNQPDYGTTFSKTVWVVGTLLAAQILVVGWVVMVADPQDSPSGAPAQTEATSLPPMTTTFVEAPVETVAPAPPAEVAETGAGSPQPDLAVASSQEQADSPIPARPFERSLLEPQDAVPEGFIGPAGAELSRAEALRQAARTVAPMDDRVLERLTEVGERHQADNNMAEALKALREVEAALPDHPRVLAGLAGVFEQMGQEEKAVSYWNRLVDLGPSAAGGYYPLAREAVGNPLSGEFAALSRSTGSTAGKVLKIGEIEVKEQQPGDQGQQVMLRVVLDALEGQQPVVDDLVLVVNFFDQVTGQGVQPSTADTSWLYPTEPYDWKTSGTEEVLVQYSQPVFTEEQTRELGERKYYGYVLELYYKEQLQDMVAMPEDLMSVRVQTPPASGGSQPRMPGPDNALFPEL